MIWADEQQAIAYERAALNCGLERILDRFIERLTGENANALQVPIFAEELELLLAQAISR